MVVQIQQPSGRSMDWYNSSNPLFSMFSDSFSHWLNPSFRHAAQGSSSNPGTHFSRGSTHAAAQKDSYYGKAPASWGLYDPWESGSYFGMHIPVLHEDTDSSSDEKKRLKVGADKDRNQCSSGALNELCIPELNLTLRDILELRDGYHLSDKHIYAAQKLLQFQFDDIDGFQDTCLSQTDSFLPVSKFRKSAQINHTRGNHWVLSTAQEGVVSLYDSLYYTLEHDLQRQMCQIYGPEFRTKKGFIKVRMAQMQKQRGLDDCALFSIAAAFEFCRGIEPETCLFDQSKMRGHLLKCFQKRELSSFPHFAKHNLDLLDEYENVDCLVEH